MVEMSENGIPDVFEPVGSGRRGLRGWEEGVGAGGKGTPEEVGM